MRIRTYCTHIITKSSLAQSPLVIAPIKLQRSKKRRDMKKASKAIGVITGERGVGGGRGGNHFEQSLCDDHPPKFSWTRAGYDIVVARPCQRITSCTRFHKALNLRGGYPLKWFAVYLNHEARARHLGSCAHDTTHWGWEIWFDGITDRTLAVGCMKTPYASEVCARNEIIVARALCRALMIINYHLGDACWLRAEDKARTEYVPTGRK